MTDVELAPEVHAALRAMRDHGDPPTRCGPGPIGSAVAGAVAALAEDRLDGKVRPWHLAALRRGAATLGDVTAARAVFVSEDTLAAELWPGGQRLLFRGVDDAWRLVRFADGPTDVDVRPETARAVPLSGWGPDAVLAALGIERPDGVELTVETEELGQGETETRHRYEWTDDGGRSILAEEVKSEIFDGATPSTTYVRGVVIDGDRGVLLTGRGDTATIYED